MLLESCLRLRWWKWDLNRGVFEFDEFVKGADKDEARLLQARDGGDGEEETGSGGGSADCAGSHGVAVDRTPPRREQSVVSISCEWPDANDGVVPGLRGRIGDASQGNRRGDRGDDREPMR